MPFYRGIEQLTLPGDQFQWGGEQLGSGGLFPTGNRKASFALIVPPQKEVPPGYFRLSTRRGKQFNSMTFSDTDPLVNGKRETIIFSPEDLRETGLTSGDPVRLHSATGEFVGIAVAGEVVRGTIIMYWPEANVLIPRGVSDPLCGIPAYRDAVVQVEKLPKSQPVS
ncbi:MAG: molybdopterin dinucleotide binding domain-containing protein [Calditrichia bacterium]